MSLSSPAFLSLNLGASFFPLSRVSVLGSSGIASFSYVAASSLAKRGLHPPREIPHLNQKPHL